MYCSSLVEWERRCVVEAAQHRTSLEPFVVLDADIQIRVSRCAEDTAGRCIRSQIGVFRRRLMVSAGVDVHMSGHNHQYERSFAVEGCDRDYRSGCRISRRMHNQRAPVYVVNGALRPPAEAVRAGVQPLTPFLPLPPGAGGDAEGIEPTWMPGVRAPFRAAHASRFRTGYGRATLNATHFEWEFLYSGERAIPGLNVSTGGSAGRVADRFVLTKDPAAQKVAPVEVA